MNKPEIDHSDASVSEMDVVKEEFRGLNRYEKGYRYEKIVQRVLEECNVDFSGNPDSYDEWLKYQVEGYDFEISLPSGETRKIECKLLLKPIFHSWFIRDWLSRDADVFVTSDPYSVPYKDRKELAAQNKKLLSTTELKMFIQRLMRGNKYSYLNSLDREVKCCNSQEIVPLETENKEKEMRKEGNLLCLFDIKEVLPEPVNAENREVKNSCSNCKRRFNCKILSEIRKIENMKPTRELIQSSLEMFLRQFEKGEKKEDFKARIKKWMQNFSYRYGELLFEQEKCLNKRSYLRQKLNYDLFDKD